MEDDVKWFNLVEGRGRHNVDNQVAADFRLGELQVPLVLSSPSHRVDCRGLRAYALGR